MASAPPPHPLDLKRLFAPTSVAVVGASDNPGKLGWHVMRSLIRGQYAGRIVPVNPGRGSVMGLNGARSLGEVDGDVDLVVVAVPAGAVPGVLTQCAEKRVGGIVLITAGFREIDDPAGARLHEHVADIVGRAAIPVIGPNTFGMINRVHRLNASFTPEFSSLAPGRIALVSQSGGVSHLLGFLAMGDRVAFSKIVGLGNRLNVDFAEMIDHLMDDPDTGVILLYVEGIDAPGRLMAAARRHRGKKPVVVYKTGSSKKGDLAARSHTGSLAGRHEIYRGAFAQAGMLVTQSAQALLDAGKALAGCPLPRGNGVAVLSGQAGPALAACDVCDSRARRRGFYGRNPAPDRSSAPAGGPALQPRGHGAGLVRRGCHPGHHRSGHGRRARQRHPAPDRVRVGQPGHAQGPWRFSDPVRPAQTVDQLHSGPAGRLGRRHRPSGRRRGLGQFSDPGKGRRCHGRSMALPDPGPPGGKVNTMQTLFRRTHRGRCIVDWALTAALMVCAAGVFFGCPVPPGAGPNVILCIGDARMGFEQVRAAGRFANGAAGTLAFEGLPDPGPGDHPCRQRLGHRFGRVGHGHGHRNNGICREWRILLEFFRDRGKRTGLVTTTYMTHATPAAFGAHEPSRGNHRPTSPPIISTRPCPRSCWGAGENGMSRSSAQAAGYTVVTDAA